MRLQTIILEEICDIINGGAWTQKEYVGNGIKVIKVSDLVQDGIDGSNLSYLPEDALTTYSKNILRAYDLVITTVGSHPQLKTSAAGRGFIIPKDYEGALLNQNAVCIRTKNESILDSRYLGYIGKSDDFRHYIQQTGRGAANQMRIAIGGIKKYNLVVPPLPTQRKIASILSAYDDLIENNLKRIKLLEEAAQNIYKEWFVNLRFPGWENAKFDKETGLPEGWKQSTIFGEVEINSGGTPKTTNPSFWNGDIPFFTPTDASKNSHFYVNQTEKTINEDGLKKCNSKLYPFNTVFITARGTVGNLCLAMIPMAMNQSCYALIGKNSLSQLFIFFSVNDSISQIKKTASGGVFDTIIVDTFKRIPFIIPEYTLILKFENQVTAILNQTQNLIIQNQKLKEARDILLPRLMNQTINV